ncbi:MAG: hypothetical protein ACJ74E_02685 [Actinomycetes bacterium]
MNYFPLAASLALASSIILGPLPASAAGAADNVTVAAASAVRTPEVTVVLDKDAYAPGDTMVLTVTENIWARHVFWLEDALGVVWTQTAVDETGATFVATAPTQSGIVTVNMLRLFDQAMATVDVPYVVGDGTVPPGTPVPPAGESAWPGQVPGKFYLGMSCGSTCGEKEQALGQPYGVHRLFDQWGNWPAVASEIEAEHAAGRLPWVSIKPPGGGAAGWSAVADGSMDDEIRALAETLMTVDDQPVLLTFHHEPSNDGSEAGGAVWAAAYSRFHDVLESAGALANVADPPIVGDWLFNPQNQAQDPANWVTEDVLSRAPFLGIDLYENHSGESFAVRIPRILDWLAAQGHPELMIGIGETGSTDAAYPDKSASDWMNESLAWVAANTDKVGVVSYFNSTSNSRPDVYWPLDENPAKLAAFQEWLANPVTVEGLPPVSASPDPLPPPVGL